MIRSRFRSACVIIVTLLLGVGAALAQEPPLLLRSPALSRDRIAFAFAGDLWIVDRSGGEARRLTTGVGVEQDCVFTPDGAQIAFTGEYDGNVDVFLVPAQGGIPRRLTYHPGNDEVVGFSPDGKRVIFRSSRESFARPSQLYTVPIEGGFPTRIPLPMAAQGSLSPDGSRLAYVPIKHFQRAWKRYRGGQTGAIWIAQLSDSSIVDRIPRQNSNDLSPMWIGQTVYFLSDRNGPVSLFAYDTRDKKVTQVVPNTGLDIKSASPGPGGIVYEQFGELYVYDLELGRSQRVPVRLAGDLPEVRPQFKRISSASLREPALSPTGVRAVFQVRGEIITVPREKGVIRNLTNTPGVAERDPAWSPDGKFIAYFSDESGEYALHLRDQKGTDAVRKIDLGSASSFFYSPVWSPDSKKIAYTDKRLNLWYVNIDGGKPILVDKNPYDSRSLNPTWSPDSRWLAYCRQSRNHIHDLFIYSLEEAKSRRVTDSMADVRLPAFDAGGKYLYFTSSTDVGLAAGGLDMTSMDRRVTRSVYAVVLRSADSSPLAPESDEEKVAEKPAEPAATPPATQPVATSPATQPAATRSAATQPARKGVLVRIDFENIDQRIIALPIPTRTYVRLEAGKANELYLLENTASETGSALHKFDLAKRRLEKVLDNVRTFRLSHNNEKMLVQQGESWSIVSTVAIRPGEGVLRLSGLQLYVDPRAEWRQMYQEVWRIERDFLYDPNHHGLDLKAAQSKYSRYLDGLASRGDLNYLFEEMLGELSLGHVYIRGGDVPQPRRNRGGLLGADYAIENGRYRFKRVYHGENWNPQLTAPLTQPGVNVVAGEYLLAVSGRELRASDNLFSFFEETAGQPIVLKVGPNPDGAGAREVTVVPIDSESSLRLRAWMDSNRRKVDRLTAGRVAYVYLPDTASNGYTNFNRYYFAQIGKEGAIIDERFNGGGKVADYMIDYLRRPLLCGWTSRDGGDTTTPLAAIFGPKAMIINEFAGSGGDALPWMFRKLAIGPLVGKRTWGGLVGIGGYPELIDGGSVTAPHFAFFNPEGTWDVENHGVTPDIEIEWDPAAWRQGRDPQLEKAVEVVLDERRRTPPAKPKKPAYPNYHSQGPSAGAAGNGAAGR